MFQNDVDYPTPELCFAIGGTGVGVYTSTDQAQRVIDYLVKEGFPEDNYFMVELKRV